MGKKIKSDKQQARGEKPGEWSVEKGGVKEKHEKRKKVIEMKSTWRAQQ